MTDKKFESLSLDEQAELANNVAQVLKNNDLPNVKVQIYREEVAKLSETEIKGRSLLRVESSLPSSKAEQVTKFNEQIKEVIQGYEGVDVKVSSALNVGDKYRVIQKVTTLDDTETEVSIEHTPGTVMMIDFWATWCPPCQRPMQHNQDMLTEHAEKWGGNVKIIGLSIDKDAATVTSHITNKGWTAPTHYHRAKSDCSDVYQVRGVPHVLIIDKEGMIAFKGHPANRKDLVQDFDDLLAGKPLDGVEKPGAEATGGEDGKGKAATLEDIKGIMGQMDKFKNETGKQLQEDCKTHASGMMRDFSVLTIDASLNPGTGAWTSEFTNHRVLVGPKDKVDACKGKIEEKMDAEGWTFEKNEQYHEQ